MAKQRNRDSDLSSHLFLMQTRFHCNKPLVIIALLIEFCIYERSKFFILSVFSTFCIFFFYFLLFIHLCYHLLIITHFYFLHIFVEFCQERRMLLELVGPELQSIYDDRQIEVIDSIILLSN